MLSARAGPSSGLALSPEIPMTYPALHPIQTPGLPGTGNSSDTLRRAISSQLLNMGGGYKEPALQVFLFSTEDFCILVLTFRLQRVFLEYLMFGLSNIFK